MVDCLRRALPSMALAGVILLAGCSGFPATDERSPTPDSTVENFSYPSGWSQDGITDLSAALRIHDATLNNTSRSTRLTIIGKNYNRTVVRALDTDTGTASVRLIDTEFGTNIHSYYSAAGVFKYDRTTGELNRHPDESWIPAHIASHEGVRRSLTELDVHAAETVTVAGTTAVRYNVTGIRDPDSVPANTATGYVVVTEKGYIAEYNITRGNDGFIRQTRYEVSAFGNATVTRPAWIPEE